MKPRYLIGLVLIIVIAALSFMMLDESSIEYADLDRAARLGKTVQVVGTWVKEDGSSYDAASNLFSFRMKDEQGKQIDVVLEGAKPNNFEIATSIVVKGRIEGSTLKASNVLTKCPSKYEGQASDLKAS
ncbi:MAG: cytochrome c maturation protein CcmE [Candidatus Kapabacteria bacterium]|nr:cytochrome c maturation protein CcmE [Candidatus Kapabacteria bacterium]